MIGLIQLYTGDGKGKTTAAIGAAVRAAGRGRRVLFVQFLKGRPTGELAALGHVPGIRIRRLSRDYGFFKNMSDADRDQVRFEHDRLLIFIAQDLQNGGTDFLVLDELAATMRHGLIDQDRVRQLLDSKPEFLEIVITGRDAPQLLVERADYISEIRKIRHPFDSGTPARKGVEW
jgi:cob(I)alamin adenosyltransferase